jgi:hypothetical protein
MTPLAANLNSSSFPDWQHDFTTAVRQGQIPAARAAIFRRLKEKGERPPGILERIALNDAIDLLRALRSERVASKDLDSIPGGRSDTLGG